MNDSYASQISQKLGSIEHVLRQIAIALERIAVAAEQSARK